MDPELEAFMRRPAQELKLQHSAALHETITGLAVAELEAGKAIVAVAQADTATIMLFDGSLSLRRELQGHAGGTNAVAFGGSSRLVSAGEDGTAAVWDPQSGNLLARLVCEGENTDR
jgi:WD40 repeat protein